MPPLPDATALPLVAPLHKGFVGVMLAVTGGGAVRFAVAVPVQPLASVTVTVIAPTDKLVTLLPFGVPED